MGRRRLERRGKAPANTDDVVLEYDRGNVIQETAAKTGAIAFSTIHAPALDAPVVSWFGQLQPSTTVYDLGTDVRGDVTIAFKNGAVHEEQLLSAYGEREAFDASGNGCVEGLDAGSRSLPVAGCTTLTVLQRFGIGGARQHPATKLVDLRHRVYAPHLRGFLTKDPLGAVDSDSLFAYVAADPVNLRDPWGLAVSEVDDGFVPDEDVEVEHKNDETIVRVRCRSSFCTARDRGFDRALDDAAAPGVNPNQTYMGRDGSQRTISQAQAVERRATAVATQELLSGHKTLGQQLALLVAHWLGLNERKQAALSDQVGGLPVGGSGRGVRAMKGKGPPKVRGLLMSSPKGLLGHEFEKWLQRKYGGEKPDLRLLGPSGRPVEFDGRYGNTLIEAKSGNFWVNMGDPRTFADFKSDFGKRIGAAQMAGKALELHSNTPVPENVREWVVSKGVRVVEH